MHRCLRFLWFGVLLSLTARAQAQARWSESRANEWYSHQPWLVGSNYLPATAVNELEMWQAETFDPREIDKEFGWAEGLGMNTMRVFLHDLLWQDAAGFQKRLDTFLAIAARHHIRPILVLFDSCWDPNPKLGPQRAPVPGVHNSRWVQSPGAKALSDPAQEPRLRAYVGGVVGAFAKDRRILAWDVWNEPSNTNGSPRTANWNRPTSRLAFSNCCLKVFAWARSATIRRSRSPAESGRETGRRLYSTSGAGPAADANARVQLLQTVVITFHNYGWPEDFERRVETLEMYHRPVVCAEYVARGVGSTFDTILPIAKKHRVAAINWGFVAGKSQTNLPWDSLGEALRAAAAPGVVSRHLLSGRPALTDRAKSISFAN